MRKPKQLMLEAFGSSHVQEEAQMAHICANCPSRGLQALERAVLVQLEDGEIVAMVNGKGTGP